MHCENCGSTHDGRFGSGRFCSKQCSRSFSTKSKRKEINKKISKALSKEKIFFSNECVICGKKFESVGFKRKVCSDICKASYSSVIQSGKEKKKGSERKKGSGGLRDGGGRSRVFEYTSRFGEMMKLNKEEIEVAKVLDESGRKWHRNWRGFSYEETKKFYPDFYVEDLDVYIEYKGWLTDAMRKKIKNSNLKNLIVVVGNDPRYSKDGISLNDLKIQIAR